MSAISEEDLPESEFRHDSLISLDVPVPDLVNIVKAESVGFQPAGKELFRCFFRAFGRIRLRSSCR
jgi:hypothetical protein